MGQKWDLLITSSTIVSLLLVIFIFIYPLNEQQILIIYIIDFAVVVLLVIDFYIRVKASPQKRKYLIQHWYEFLAMIPLALLGTIDSVTAANYSLLSFKLLTVFRTVRLFQMFHSIRGSEIFIMTIIAAVTIILGAFGEYIVESPNPDAP